MANDESKPNADIIYCRMSNCKQNPIIRTKQRALFRYQNTLNSARLPPPCDTVQRRLPRSPTNPLATRHSQKFIFFLINVTNTAQPRRNSGVNFNIFHLSVTTQRTDTRANPF
ncbi:hypothetical protein L798_07627 [Zootermopsis nevadensis]|uniref:Uncharacterized protein n=1 Tax=Zootermopsis nevadensis TaxID=136037 RepID=A0A067RTS9_ZOONE|nr:hypothetical protein L798_07627 [Zootermopsis nevadensis]